MCFLTRRLRPTYANAADLQEEARLCREAALSSEDMGVRQAFADRALDFAFLGEEMAGKVMLPTPEELRERSRQLREAAHKTTDDTIKRRLADDALALAQIAEGIAREGGMSDDKVERYKRLLAEVLGHKPPAEVQSDRGQQVGTSMRSHVRAWRMRAEELRMTADQFKVPSAQEALRSAARNYELMADNLENLLGTHPARDEKAG